MKILFWGTPAYALPSLEALMDAGHELVGVVSQPDRRRGRGASLMPSPVKARALERGLPVFTPERIRRDSCCQAELANLGADLSVVVAFGQILPPSVLEQPPLGCWNAHGSLLPRWRGAAPIQWCLLEGDSETGVGVMAMEEGLDTGPVLLERSQPVGLRQNAAQVAEQLAALSATLLVEACELIEQVGTGPAPQRLEQLGLRAQGEEGITLARLLTKADTLIDWSRPALALHRQVMGLYPGARSLWGGRQLKLLDSEPLVERLRQELSPEAARLVNHWGGSQQAAPGTVLAVEEGVGLVVATGGCPLLVRSAQLEGKRAAAGAGLLQQLQPRPGDSLGG